MKLASGIARIDEMLAAGCRVALGLDGAHNHMDALVELRQAGILQKVRTNRPTALSPLQALEMATLGGARALGQEDELGSLEPGKMCIRDRVIGAVHGFGAQVADAHRRVVRGGEALCLSLIHI